MGRIRNWMHGKGRGIVIVVMILLALWIIVDFYRTNHEQPEQSDKPVQQMAPVKDASSEDTQDADTREDTDSTAKPDDADSTPDQQDGQTESEEDVGAGSEACRTE